MPVGPLHSCPQCGARALHCAQCASHRTDVGDGYYCCGVASDGSDRKSFFRGPPGIYPLTFTHGTSATRLCSPQRRVRMGFLWRRRCLEPGVHVHQKCERCDWRGVARVLPERPRALPTAESDLGSSEAKPREEAECEPTD